MKVRWGFAVDKVTCIVTGEKAKIMVEFI